MVCVFGGEDKKASKLASSCLKSCCKGLKDALEKSVQSGQFDTIINKICELKENGFQGIKNMKWKNLVLKSRKFVESDWFEFVIMAMIIINTIIMTTE